MNRRFLAALVAFVLIVTGTAGAAVPVFASSEAAVSEEDPGLTAGEENASEEAGKEEEVSVEGSDVTADTENEVPSDENEQSSSAASAEETDASTGESAEETDKSVEPQADAADETKVDGSGESQVDESGETQVGESGEPQVDESGESQADGSEEPAGGESQGTEVDETGEAGAGEASAPDETAVSDEETVAASEGEEPTEADPDEDLSDEELVEADEPAVVGTTAPFEEGDYYIFSALSDKAVFDIAGGKITSKANLQLYTINYTAAQKFHVAWNSDGTAAITCVKSGLVLDAAGRGTTIKTNVQQYAYNGTAAQKWTITDAARAGYYTIKASYTNLVMDAAGGACTNGTNVQLYTPNNSRAQQWKFVAVSDVKVVSKASIATGYYKIRLAKNTDRCIEVADDSFAYGGNIALGPKSQEAAQVFYITNLGNGWYTLESCLTGYMFSVDGMTASFGKNILQSRKTGADNQKWYITECDGLYTIATGLNTNYVVDAAGGATTVGTNVRIYVSNNTIAQKWILEEADVPTAILASGNYCITCASNASLAVSVPAEQAVKGSNVALSTYKGSSYQKFIVTSFGDGTYKIIVAGSAMALDVALGSKLNRANVQQYTYNGTTAQRWKIVGSRGIYKIIGYGSGKAIDVADGKIADGSNLQIYTDNGTKAQQFCFTPVNSLTGSVVTSAATDASGVTHYYAVDPATGKKFEIEPEYLDDPRVGEDVTEDDFFAAVLYTEAGGQGTDGMLMVAYVIKNRMAKGIEAASTGAYVEYPGTLDIMIYQKEQWQVARTKDNGDPAPLGNVLRDIVNGSEDYLDEARKVVAMANSGADIVLVSDATLYNRTGENSSLVTKLPAGTHIKASEFDYNSFMTPKAWLRYAQDGKHTKFKANYLGNNAFIYSGAVTSQGHVFFYDEDVW